MTDHSASRVYVYSRLKVLYFGKVFEQGTAKQELSIFNVVVMNRMARYRVEILEVKKLVER